MISIALSVFQMLTHKGPRRTKTKMFLGIDEPENRFIEGDKWVKGKDAIMHIRKDGKWVPTTTVADAEKEAATQVSA